MRTETYTVTRTLYHFNELSDESKRAFIDDDYAMNEFSYESDDMLSTLNAFAKSFNIRMIDWNCDGYSHWFTYNVEEDNADQVSGLRLTKYVINHFLKNIEVGKRYAKLNNWNRTERHSNISHETDCTLTGYYLDYDVLKPVIDCINYKIVYDSMDDMINDCLNNLFKAFEDDYQSRLEYDAVNEVCEINNWEFTKDGNIA